MNMHPSDRSGLGGSPIEGTAHRPLALDRSTIELIGAGGHFLMASQTWHKILDLARSYGWQPAGTEAPDRLPRLDPWTGEYAAHSGQRVTAEDARELVRALDRAAGEIPDDGAPPRGDAALAAFAGDNKPWLRNLIAFCRAGRFYIW